MVLNQARPQRKPSGGRYKQQKIRRQHESGSEPAFTKLDSPRVKNSRKLGGERKHKSLAANVANVVDAKTGKFSQVSIKNIKENPANRHFVRRNIMTKGTIIETDMGDARVTNRPGQQGHVQAVLL